MGKSLSPSFFRTDLGNRLRSGREVLREFKFSILDDASSYYAGVSDDKILLQGVIDCALVEEEGITVLDFKTDYITDANRSERIARYREQVNTYAKALSRIYEMPITDAFIYFFSSDEFIRVD